MNEENSIAIIGIGCRFPGGINNPQDFWDVLLNKRNGIIEVPEDRWNHKLYYSRNRNIPGRTISKWGGFIDNFNKFDPTFFSISPREASVMDPQQRKMLEVTWEAFEDGGLVPSHYKGKDVGVFIAGFTLDYKLIQFDDIYSCTPHSSTGTMMTMLSNRISYIYDFKGPSVSIDTACSGSLVSLHMACQSLRNNECSMAVAGGVQLHILPHYTLFESIGGFLSADGKCKTFDASADGYVRGDGAAAVILKPYKKALEDNNEIWAVIRGSAVNQDGYTKGITIPNSIAQQSVMKKALKDADISPDQVSFIEAHGTGTAVGDPLEADAIGNCYGIYHSDNSPLYIGSVKTNIGHTESAAGMAGIIKTALCLRNKKIVPNLHFKNPNPKIDFKKFNFFVPENVIDIETSESLIAGVNSFGFGGTNAHVLLQSCVNKADKDHDSKNLYDDFIPLLISAETEEGLSQRASDYANAIKNSQEDIYDIAYSAFYHKEKHKHKTVVLAKSKSELIQELNNVSNGIISEKIIQGSDVYSNHKKGIVFVFTGMGLNGGRWGGIYSLTMLFTDMK